MTFSDWNVDLYAYELQDHVIVLSAVSEKKRILSVALTSS